MSEKLKIFVSWSGAYSNALAEVFSEWLEKSVQSAEPFVSSTDIESGSRWGSRLTGELSQLDYGVAFITSQNKEAPWVLFEAGALSKNVKEGRFTPVLCGISNVDLTGNPLIQFQTRELNAQGIKKLFHSIFNAADKESYSKEKVDDIFDVWWPKLDTKINELASSDKFSDADTSDEDATIKQLEASVSDLVEVVRDVALHQEMYAMDLQLEISALNEGSKNPKGFKKEKFKSFEAFKTSFTSRYDSDEIYHLLDSMNDSDDLNRLLKISEAFEFQTMSLKINEKIESLMPGNFGEEE